jgi:hypothetical protein
MRYVLINPAHDCCVGKGLAALSHHLDRIPQAQLKAQVPTDTQDGAL